ncbi:DnaD domain protein [Enterococcus faecalis]
MTLNYLQQILAFDDYLLYKQKLSSGQIALWRALMSINNKAGWATWFTAANATLESLSGLSRSGINKNRNVLKQLGLIDFKSNGRKATSYKVCVLYTLNSAQDSTQQSNDKVTLKSTTQSTNSGTLIKHKQNINTNNSFSPETDKNKLNIYAAVEQNFGRPLSPIEMEMIKQWQTEDGYPDDLIQLALKEAVLNQAFSLKYMDRILLSWERKGIKTKNQAIKKISEYNMRNDQEEISVDSIPKVTMHNWLNPEGN